VWVILVIAFVVFIVLLGFLELNQSPEIPFFDPMVIIFVCSTFIGGPTSFVFGLIMFFSTKGWKTARHKVFIFLGFAIITIGSLALGITLALPLFYHPPKLSVTFIVLAVDLVAIGVGLMLSLRPIRDTGYYGLTLFTSGPLMFGLMIGATTAGMSQI
jgi:hypothetical protein